jgi:PIN domain nuclease of toxin-antitoxin system
MKLLLDTLIWLWSVANSERLSHRLYRAINDPRNELWISPISTQRVRLFPNIAIQPTGYCWRPR